MGGTHARKSLKNLFSELLISAHMPHLDTTSHIFSPPEPEGNEAQLRQTQDSSSPSPWAGIAHVFYKLSGWLNYSNFSLGESCSDIKTHYILSMLIFLASPQKAVFAVLIKMICFWLLTSIIFQVAMFYSY